MADATPAASPKADRGITAWYAGAVAVAAGAGVVAAAALAGLVWAHIANRRADPLNSRELAAMKNRLAADPKDRELTGKVRELDLALRQQHFRHVAFARGGNLLLLGGAAVFLLAARSAAALGKRLGRPRGGPPGVPEEMRSARRMRLATGALAGVLGAAAAAPAVVSLYVRWTAGPPAPPHAADPAEVARYWPRFRGPGGGGVSVYANVPDAWDANAPSGILWKAEVPLPGKNSPVVWGKRVFLTGATAERREVFCFDADSGRLLWRRAAENIPGSPPRPPHANEETGHAAPTAVADDLHVLAIFANGDLVCFDHHGSLVWSKALGAPKNQYGYASSLAMWRHLLLVLWDQASAEDFMSKLLAFDAGTGRLVWQVRRPVANSWATPLVLNDSRRDQVVTSANPWVISYDPADGRELWRAKVMEGGDVASSPIYADGLIYAVCAETKLSAIRPDGAGDVTATHVLWQGDEGLPDITSPLSDGKLVWLLTTGGDLTCYDAKAGGKVYTAELKGNFNASPSLAGGRLYLVTTKGLTYIIGAGPKFEVLRTCDLREPVYASPAFQDGRIYIRTSRHLCCIGGSTR